MKKKSLPFLLLPLTLILAFDCPASPADADSPSGEEPVWSGGFELSAGRNYVWRGIPCYENGIFHPDAWLTYKSLTLEIWGALTTSEKDISPRRHEFDFILTHEFELKGLTLTNAFYYYHYIHQPGVPATGEWIGSAEYPLGAFTLAASVGVDVIEYSGALYLEPGVSFEKELGGPVSLSTALRLGTGSKKFNEAYAGLSRPAVNFASWEGRLTWSLENGLYLQPYVLLAKTLDRRLTEAFNGRNSSLGLAVGWEH
jgi:hypothetical protein